MWLTLLARYWKPLAALALAVLLLSWAYGAGYSRANDRCKAENAKVTARLVKRIQQEQARANEIDARLQGELAKPKPAAEIRSIVRANPSKCVVPAAVGDGLREAIDRANAPAG